RRATVHPADYLAEITPNGGRGWRGAFSLRVQSESAPRISSAKRAYFGGCGGHRRTFDYAKSERYRVHECNTIADLGSCHRGTGVGQISQNAFDESRTRRPSVQHNK